MNPYNIKTDDLNDSEEMTDERELLKLKLLSVFLKVTAKMKTEEVLNITGLHKSDFSRLRSMNIQRFTIDRMIGLLASLGYSTKINVKPKRAS